ncbi:hypothetical protein SDC9_57943 [bioreactor metagenome]|uniref:Uncharacterized protein n=1 Tax=bioreactor metagenome TaxID=1076179 RepID=A0A644X6N2_9ZZZZ
MQSRRSIQRDRPSGGAADNGDALRPGGNLKGIDRKGAPVQVKGHVVLTQRDSRCAMVAQQLHRVPACRGGKRFVQRVIFRFADACGLALHHPYGIGRGISAVRRGCGYSGVSRRHAGDHARPGVHGGNLRCTAAPRNHLVQRRGGADCVYF